MKAALYQGKENIELTELETPHPDVKDIHIGDRVYPYPRLAKGDPSLSREKMQLYSAPGRLGLRRRSR